MKKIYYLFFILIVTLLSCENSEEENYKVNQISDEYTFDFVCHEEPISLVYVLFLDKKGNKIDSIGHRNLPKGEHMRHSFNNSTKFKIYISDEEFLHTFLYIRKNNIIVEELVLNGYYFNNTTVDLLK